MPEFERIADPGDHASRIEEINLQADIAEHRKQVEMGKHPGPDYTICIACDDAIETIRVQHQFARCLSCQVKFETRKKQFN